jgi:hypothetical protein
MNIGLADMSIPISYVAGYVTVGNGTGGGSDGAVCFSPSTNNFTAGNSVAATTRFSLFYTPVCPADISSLTSGTGYGVPYLYDVFRHFARVRYDSMLLEVIPRGLGSNTTTGVTVAVAPYRGGVDAGANTPFGVNGPYSYGVGGTGASAGTVNILGHKGAVQFPLWESMRMDLTPYIAGGSGARQNEFPMNVTGNTTIATVMPAILVPVSFCLGGTCPLSSPLAGGLVATVIIRANVSLLDFMTPLTTSMTPIGRDEKDTIPRPSALDFKSALMRRDAPVSPSQSLLGAALDPTYSDPAPVRTRPVAIPAPNAKR